MPLSRKARTREAILRAVLTIVLEERELTKPAVCAQTPCSAATLYRFFPDLKRAERESFSCQAAQSIDAPFRNGLLRALHSETGLEACLRAIVQHQGFFIRTNLQFTRKVSQTLFSQPETNADATTALETATGAFLQGFIDNLIQRKAAALTGEVDRESLRVTLRELIGYQALDQSYRAAQEQGVTYEDYCEALIQEAVQCAQRDESTQLNPNAVRMSPVLELSRPS